MASNEETVFIVDDDEAFRDSVEILCESVGLRSRAFDSAGALLAELDPAWSGCLVLDIRMPGMSGLELQDELHKRACQLPIIFMTGHGDVPMAVRAMKSGAYDFLSKPFPHQALLDLIHSALRGHQEERRRSFVREELEARLQRLTPREAEIMALVVEGLANKVIASRLAISQRTVEIHRSQVMEKMQAASLAELVRMAIQLEGS